MCIAHSEGARERAQRANLASAEARRNRQEERKRRAIDRIRDAAEARADEFIAIQTAIARDPTAAAADRLRAIENLNNRAWGRPEPREEPSEPVVDVLALARAKLAERSSS